MVLQSGESFPRDFVISFVCRGTTRLTLVFHKTTAYFQKLVQQMDLNSFSMPENVAGGADLEGRISRPKREPLKPVFEPMRRKMGIPTQ